MFFFSFKGCFDGNSLISKADGSHVRINQLSIGDEVLVAQFDIHGNIKFHSSPILAIDIYQHHDHRSPVHYREIYTTMNSTALYITPSHLLLVRKKHSASLEYIFASQLNIDDHLYFVDGHGRLVNESRVTAIHDVALFDAYAPLTFEGNIIVNHFIASCYGTFPHSIKHIITIPRRWFLYWKLDVLLFHFIEFFLFI